MNITLKVLRIVNFDIEDPAASKDLFVAKETLDMI